MPAPVALGDMTLTFAGTVRVPGRLMYLHPVHNFAIIQYDPARLGDTPVGEITWATGDIEKGDAIWHVGRNRDHLLKSKRSKVERFEPRWFGMSQTPRFRDSNVDVIDPEEVELERGVLLEEWRVRSQSYSGRYFDGVIDVLLAGTPYADRSPLADEPLLEATNR